jgi:hypothetical protein
MIESQQNSAKGCNYEGHADPHKRKAAHDANGDDQTSQLSLCPKAAMKGIT